MQSSTAARRARRAAAIGAAGISALAIAACGSSGSGSSGGGSAAAGGGSSSGKAPIKVGYIYSKTGLLASYGAEQVEGFKVGLDYATHGTDTVDGHKIEVTYEDGAADPTKAVSAFKDLVGKGYRIIAGPTDSGVSLQLAPLAEQNQVLYISGPAAADGITGANKYTFRSGRQTYQDVETAASIIGDPKGKKVLVFAQDYAFGQANAAAVKAVLGGAGADVSSLLVPLSAKDFTPFAEKIKQAHPDLLFVAWAGDSTTPMWSTLNQQGVLDSTTVVTGLGNVASYPAYGKAATKVDFLSYYFPQAPHNAVNRAMVKGIEADGQQPDLFSPDGFVAAQMIVHAIQQAGGDDVDKMVSALEGWTFTAPKGQETVRASDHAMIQPMYVAKLTPQDKPKLVKTVPADQVAPPAKSGG